MKENDIKREKTIRIITVVLGALMILSGIIIMTFSNSHTGSSGSGLSRASTSIQFGADYYTTSAQYMGLAANAACDTYSLIKICFSLSFIFAGAFVILKEISPLLSVINAEKELKTATISDEAKNETATDISLLLKPEEESKETTEEISE